MLYQLSYSREEPGAGAPNAAPASEPPIMTDPGHNASRPQKIVVLEPPRATPADQPTADNAHVMFGRHEELRTNGALGGQGPSGTRSTPAATGDAGTNDESARSEEPDASSAHEAGNAPGAAIVPEEAGALATPTQKE